MVVLVMFLWFWAVFVESFKFVGCRCGCSLGKR